MYIHIRHICTYIYGIHVHTCRHICTYIEGIMAMHTHKSTYIHAYIHKYRYGVTLWVNGTQHGLATCHGGQQAYAP